MEKGMLWLDDDQKRTFEEKVKRAAVYFRDKYGLTPNLCFVNMNSLQDEIQIDKLIVRPVKNVLPQHFLVGVAS